GAVRAEVAEDVAGLDGQVDVVDRDDVAVALDQAAGGDRRRARHPSARAAASAAAGGSEPARTYETPPRRHSSTVPSCVASSFAVTPSSEIFGRLASGPCCRPPLVSAFRSTTTIAPRPWP